MPKVYNVRDPKCPNDAIYVGRPTKWGNPWSHREGTLALYKVNTREEAISKYADWLDGAIETGLLDLDELQGKDLSCWCAPLPCHADVLLEMANK